MRRFLFLSLLTLAASCGHGSRPGEGRGESRSSWPASAQAPTFERVGPLSLGHPLADTPMERECRKSIEAAVGSRESTQSAQSTQSMVNELESLLDTCGEGFGIAWRIGHLLLLDADPTAAGPWLVREVSGRYPLFGHALRDIGEMLDTLGPAERQTLAALGMTPEAPMWLPTTELQMGFIAAFVCNGDARYVGQALIDQDRPMLDSDRIGYECVETGEGARYFALPLRSGT